MNLLALGLTLLTYNALASSINCLSEDKAASITVNFSECKSSTFCPAHGELNGEKLTVEARVTESPVQGTNYVSLLIVDRAEKYSLVFAGFETKPKTFEGAGLVIIGSQSSSGSMSCVKTN